MSDVAVCILADSSLTLADQWQRIIATYISALLSRLHEGRASDSFHIAVVTYATADQRPTPILAKRYFNNPVFVTKELKEDAFRLGIGRTGTGARMGMAALEGYAAALELFDLFLSSPRTTKEDKSPVAESQTGPLCHIIHISACHPDESQHPSWNQTTNLDTLTWKTLPDELRKRNVNLNVIMLKPNKSFAELHASANSESHKPWFKVPEVHSVLLSPAASWAALIVKRDNETAEPEKATDGKRVASPKPASAAPPSQTPLIPKPPENDLPPSASLMPTRAGLQQAIAALRELDPQIKAAQTQIEMLRQQGRTQEVEILKRSMNPKLMTYMALRRAIISAQVKLAGGTGSGNVQTGNPSDVTMKTASVAGPSGQNQTAPSTTQNTAGSQPPQALPTQPAQQPVQLQRPGQQANTGAPAAADVRPPPNMQISPNIAAQMQKLQAKEGISGLSAMPHHQQQPSVPHQTPQNNLPNQPTQVPPNPQQNQPQSLDGSQTWVGTISWINPQVMTIMEAQVRMTGNRDIRPQIWPSRVEIEVLRDQKVSLPALKDWIAKHAPVLCQLRPVNPQNQENLLRLNSLSSLMHDRNTYAIGRRSPSSENPQPMLLLFSTGGSGQLIAAVFPETGVPELPSSNVNPNPNPNTNPQPHPQAAPGMRPPTANPSGNTVVNPQVMAMLQSMSPEQRAEFLTRIRRQQQLQQAQAQQQAALAAGANNPSSGGNPPNATVTPVPNALPNLPGGGGWPAGRGMPAVPMGQNMPNLPQGMPPGMNPGLAQALAALQQQQRQANMQGRPGSGGPPQF